MPSTVAFMSTKRTAAARTSRWQLSETGLAIPMVGLPAMTMMPVTAAARVRLIQKAFLESGSWWIRRGAPRPFVQLHNGSGLVRSCEGGQHLGGGGQGPLRLIYSDIGI